MNRNVFKRILRTLEAENGLSAESSERLWEETEGMKTPEEALVDLVTLYEIDGNSLRDLLSELYQKPIVELDPGSAAIPDEIVLDAETCRANHFFPFDASKGKLEVAVFNPGNISHYDVLQSFCSLSVKISVASYKDIHRAIDSFFDDVRPSMSMSLDEEENEIDWADAATEAPSSRAQADPARLENYLVDLIGNALDQRCTEIRFRCAKQAITVEYIIDDEPVYATSFSRRAVDSLAFALANLFRVQFSESRSQHEIRGNVPESLQPRLPNVRLSRIVLDDETRYVLHLPNLYILNKRIDQIGFTKSTFTRFDKAMDKETGLLVIASPKRGGKSTTLYHAARHLFLAGRSVHSIENTILCESQDITQWEVDTERDRTSLQLLNLAIRDFPGVIIVDPVDDPETLERCVEVARLGILVIIGFHASSIGECVQKLVKMGLSYGTISSMLRGIVVQDIVRRVCRHCRSKIRPSQKEKDIAAEFGIDTLNRVYVERGCERCRNTGYYKRTGVFESLFMTNAIRSFFSSWPDLVQINRRIRQDGIKRLEEYAYIKAMTGHTTFAEAHRVVGDWDRSLIGSRHLHRSEELLKKGAMHEESRTIPVDDLPNLDSFSS